MFTDWTNYISGNENDNTNIGTSISTIRCSLEDSFEKIGKDLVTIGSKPTNCEMVVTDCDMVATDKWR